MNKEALIEKVCEVFELTGQVVLKAFKKNSGHKIKEDGSPLAAADILANQIIKNYLLEHWPGIPILSEEDKTSHGSVLSADLYWAIDPIDGTKEFIQKSGDFTINIALIEERKPIFGAIYAPYHSDCWIGLNTEKSMAIEQKQKSSYKFRLDCFKNNSVNLKKEEISVNRNIRKTLKIAVSKSHNSTATDIWQRVYFPNQKIYKIERGSSIKICMIAEGEADYYPRFGPTCIWDVVAGHAILCGAGGNIYRMSNFDYLTYGDTIFNENFLACKY